MSSRRVLILVMLLCWTRRAPAAPAGLVSEKDEVAATDVRSAPPASVETPPPPLPSRFRRRLAIGGVAASYGLVTAWAYLAWFRGEEYKGVKVVLSGFSVDAYAGGLDKLGHAWASYALSRVTTSMLIAGGGSRFTSSLIGSSLSQLFFTLSEVEDGLVHEIEIGDLIANVSGAALSMLMFNVPSIDRWLDFRLEYFPTKEYRRSLRDSGNLDFAQDYSGQSYMLALHLSELPGPPDRWWSTWIRNVDVVAGFETRNYAPKPDDESARPRQTLYLGLALNVQHVLETLFCDTTGRRIATGTFELISIPYTTLKLGTSRRPDPIATP